MKSGDLDHTYKKKNTYSSGDRSSARWKLLQRKCSGEKEKEQKKKKKRWRSFSKLRKQSYRRHNASSRALRLAMHRWKCEIDKLRDQWHTAGWLTQWQCRSTVHASIDRDIEFNFKIGTHPRRNIVMTLSVWRAMCSAAQCLDRPLCVVQEYWKHAPSLHPQRVCFELESSPLQWRRNFLRMESWSVEVWSVSLPTLATLTCVSMRNGHKF